MNKADLVGAISDRTGANRSAVDGILSIALEIIVEQVAQGHRIKLVGFGCFEPQARKQRVGRNPKTGEQMSIPAQRVPKFVPGAGFKAAVGGKADG